MPQRRQPLTSGGRCRPALPGPRSAEPRTGAHTKLGCRTHRRRARRPRKPLAKPAHRKQRTYMGMPLDTYAQLREQPCGQCGAEADQDGNIPQRDRSVFCLPESRSPTRPRRALRRRRLLQDRVPGAPACSMTSRPAPIGCVMAAAGPFPTFVQSGSVPVSPSSPSLCAPTAYGRSRPPNPQPHEPRPSGAE